MVIGWVKEFNLSIETVLWDMSWVNLVMYTSALPRYNDEKKQEWDDTKDACDPANIVDGPDVEYVKKF